QHLRRVERQRGCRVSRGWRGGRARGALERAHGSAARRRGVMRAMSRIMTQPAGRSFLGDAETMLRTRLQPVLKIMPQLSRYTLVSAVALALDFTLYLLLALGGLPAVVAGAVGYACGLGLHYMLSVRYVFDPAAAGKQQSRLIAEFAM